MKDKRKIAGLFRGFPGLGRVMSGMEILDSLRDEFGCEIKAFSYWQGEAYLRGRKGFCKIGLDAADVCPIGILPTGAAGAELVEKIAEFSPEAVVVDGEPLMLHQLKCVFPKLKVISLLNPSDVENSGNRPCHMAYFRTLYSMADMTIVHGLRQVENPGPFAEFHSQGTILRKRICEIVRKPDKRVYCILGGGTVNVDSSFEVNTLEVARLTIGAMSSLPDFELVVACACPSIAIAVRKMVGDRKNVVVCDSLLDPGEIYSAAAAVVTRAGRNTLSELAWLGIPSVAFGTGGRFRTTEQSTNLQCVRGALKQADLGMPQEEFNNLLRTLVTSDDAVPELRPNGREVALRTIAGFLGMKAIDE